MTRQHIVIMLIGAAAIAAIVAVAVRIILTQPAPPQVAHNMVEAFDGLHFHQPVELFEWVDGKIAVVEQFGIIRAHEPESRKSQIILDLSDVVDCCFGEAGMLGAALTPNIAHPHLYIYYMPAVENEEGEGALGRLSRFTIIEGRALRESELIILEVPQDLQFHNGGALRFGPDGMIYLGLGDDCAAPHLPQILECVAKTAQSLASLRGSIIRIDVEGASSARPYRVPADNPFVSVEGARPEIYASGLRNPWRMAFDEKGRLFVGDVGRIVEEEVSLVTAGANLGWPYFEGNACIVEAALCEEFIAAEPPIAAYGRDDGCAIIGGTIHSRSGAFIYGDYCYGTVWALEEDAELGWQSIEIAQLPAGIRSFGQAHGAVYLLTRDGPIMRLSDALPLDNAQ